MHALARIVTRVTVAALASASFCAAASAAAATSPLRDDHPIVGTWRFVLPDGSCHELYRMRADGTALIISAAEVTETEFAIDDQPDADGYYKAVDKVVKENGKQDCSGNLTKVGQSVNSFILFHPSRNMFVMCLRRSTDVCLGPFVRVKGTET